MENKLIILLVIILGAVAIAQLVRVYELSSKLRKTGEHEISTRDNHLNAKMMLGFMILFFGSVVYLFLKYGWTGRGEAASIGGVETDWLLELNLIIVTIVFFFTNFLLFYFTYKYVKKPGVPAFYYPHNNKLEMLWTVVPAVVLAVIIILGLKTWNNLTGMSGKDAIHVELFSKQFDWTARYSGEDNVLGKFDYKLTTQENELALLTSATLDSAIRYMEFGKVDSTVLGIKLLENKLNNPKNIFIPEDRIKMEADLDRKTRFLRLLYQMKARHNGKLDASAYDDILQKDTLHLLKGKEYEISFRAKDVLHSAYFPHLRAQINAVPGQVTRLKVTPTISTKEMRERKNNPKFNYVLMCNKICGSAHYKMKMIVVIDSPAKYKAWEKSKTTFKDQFLSVPAPAPAATSDSTQLATK